MAAELWVPASDPRSPPLVESATHYSYDPRRAAELLRELGWRRGGADDLLVRQGRRFELDLATTTDWERAGAAVGEYWRQAGIGVRDAVFALSAVTDRQNRALYSGIEVAGGTPNLTLLDGRLHSANAPRAENQWIGPNRGHYASPSLDVLLERIQVSLDRDERAATEREIARHISAELPIMGLFFYPAMAMTRLSVDGVRPPLTVSMVGRLSLGWNAHEWRRA
jgi:peptide/nickel transport system substrate-binding protein